MILALLSSACKEITQATPAPTPIPLRLAHTPASRPWADRLGQCASHQPEMAMFIEERPFSQEDIASYDAFIRLGALDRYPGFAAVLGYEQVELALNPANPIDQLEASSISKLFSGMIATWQSFNNPAGAVFSGAVQIWSYLPGDELRALPMQDDLPATAWLAYDPRQVIEGIAAEAGAAGYVPASWLENSDVSLKTAALPATLRQELRLPVIAYSSSEPQGALRSLLGCASQPGK